MVYHQYLLLSVCFSSLTALPVTLQATRAHHLLGYGYEVTPAQVARSSPRKAQRAWHPSLSATSAAQRILRQLLPLGASPAPWRPGILVCSITVAVVIILGRHGGDGVCQVHAHLWAHIIGHGSERGVPAVDRPVTKATPQADGFLQGAPCTQQCGSRVLVGMPMDTQILVVSPGCGGLIARCR